jgi:quercetin dioxygenase-like cupin family protein
MIDAGVVAWDTVAPFAPHPGVEARRFDSDGVTVIRYELQEGARYPLHTHVQEQYFQVISGHPTAIADGEAVPLAPGDLLLIPAGVPHGARSERGKAVFLSISPRRAE